MRIDGDLFEEPKGSYFLSLSEAEIRNLRTAREFSDFLLEMVNGRAINYLVYTETNPSGYRVIWNTGAVVMWVPFPDDSPHGP